MSTAERALRNGLPTTVEDGPPALRWYGVSMARSLDTPPDSLAVVPVPVVDDDDDDGWPVKGLAVEEDGETRPLEPALFFWREGFTNSNVSDSFHGTTVRSNAGLAVTAITDAEPVVVPVVGSDDVLLPNEKRLLVRAELGAVDSCSRGVGTEDESAAGTGKGATPASLIPVR